MRHLLLAAVLASAIALTTACSGSADLSDVANAANKTENAKSSRYWMSFESKEGDGGQLDGAIDFENDRGFMTTKAGTQSFKTIWIGSTYYVKMPAGFSPSPKSWLKIEDDGSTFPAFSQLPLLQPTRLFELLKGAGSFTESGKDVVRDVPTTRFDGSVETKKFFAAMLPAVEGDDSEDVPEGSFDVSVWIDENEFVRRIAFDAPTVGEDVGGRLTLEFWAIGEPIDVVAPPADQIREVDLPDTDKLGSYSETSTSGSSHTVTFESTGG